jgi:hypothetical protein
MLVDITDAKILRTCLQTITKLLELNSQEDKNKILKQL